MSGNKILRAVLFISLTILGAKFLWTGFFAFKAVETVGQAQVKIAAKDVERIGLILDMLWYGYDLDETNEKPFKTMHYDVFCEKIQEIMARYTGMPANLPSGQNFASFSYSGSEKSYRITVKAKDKNRTVVHGTPERVWHE